MPEDSFNPELPHAPHDGVLSSLVAFVADQRSEESVRALAEGPSVASATIRRGGCRDAVTYLSQASTPSLVLVDLTGSETPLSDMDELVSVCGPNTVIIAMGEVNDIGLYRDLAMFGVADYLVKPVTLEVLRRTIGLHTGTMRAQGLSRRQRIGKVICVTGARGGVGATSFATNLAWILSNDASRRTIIVDLDLHCGAVSLMLGVKSSPGFMEALRNPHRIDDLFLDRAIVRKTDRLTALSAEEPLEDNADYSPAALDAVLRALQHRFHYVIMDMPRRPGTLFRQALEQSEIQMIVATPTLAAVRDVMRISSMIGREDLGQRALLVLNRPAPGGKGEISRQDFEKTIGRRVDYDFAHSRLGMAADNQGEMLAETDPVFGETMGRVVGDLVGRVPTRKQTARGLFGLKGS